MLRVLETSVTYFTDARSRHMAEITASVQVGRHAWCETCIVRSQYAYDAEQYIMTHSGFRTRQELRDAVWIASALYA